MYVAPHHTPEELQHLRKKERDPRVAQRLQAVVWAQQGQSASAIAALACVQSRTVQNWMARYNQQSVEGLRDHYVSGNQNKLTMAQKEQVTEYLDQQAQDPRASICQGRHLHAWIAQQFGIVYSLSGIYGLLHRLGYCCLVPRPRHPQADPGVQEAFKKTSPSRSRPSRRPTRRKPSRSGLAMRPASVNRGP